jgi:hypothetical protein
MERGRPRLPPASSSSSRKFISRELIDFLEESELSFSKRAG